MTKQKNAIRLGAFMHAGKWVVSSFSLAKTVHKRPKDLREVVKQIIAIRGTAFGDENFIPSTYEDKKGETRPEFLLTCAGCDALAEKLQGPKAKKFSEVYTEWFDRVGKTEKAITVVEQNTEPIDLGIFIKDNVPVVSTRKIAEWFNKPHKTVIDAVRTCCAYDDGPFNRQNFLPVEYSDSRGRKQPEYLVTEDGFMKLVMGFTGKKANQIKNWFIAEFKAMKNQLKNITAVPTFDPTNALESAKQLQAALGALIKSEEARKQSEEARKKLQTQNYKLIAQAEENAPKVKIADAFLLTKTDLDARTYAQILTQGGLKQLALKGKLVPMGQNNFIWWLLENHFISRVKGGFTPIGVAKNKDLIKIIPTEIKRIGKNYLMPYIRAAGQVYFIKELLRQEAERNQLGTDDVKLLAAPDENGIPQIDFSRKRRKAK